MNLHACKWRVIFRLSALSEKLKRMAELNFCKNCYSKYLASVHGEIEHLLSEPISNWRQTEANIDIMWVKAKGFICANMKQITWLKI